MSKMDALRAMREARYAEMTARTAASPAKKKAVAPVAPGAAKKAAVKEAPVQDATEELCGHRNMSGRTCTREQGHSAKSHRYS
jgi:hypothetical protein